ncbi:MAG: LiaF transmembrane domain-containing protein [Anaerolineae bacterium]
MSTQQSGSKIPEQAPEPEQKSDYDGRMEQRESRHGAQRGSGGWVLGIILIIVGLYLVLQNFGVAYFNNWWALFILIPAVGALASAWREYNQAGKRLVRPARGPLIAGIVLLAVTAIFLFSLNWGIVGPLLLILAGVSIVLNVVLPG